jgi:hypothetical protein
MAYFVTTVAINFLKSKLNFVEFIVLIEFVKVIITGALGFM